MYVESQKWFYYAYDLDATSFKYGRIGGPDGLGCPSKYGAKTTGSSITVNAAAGTPFDPVNVGDMIVFFKPPDATPYIRKVATKASGAQITVDTAIDLGTVGVPFDFYPFKIGTGPGAGWHHVEMYSVMTLHVRIDNLAAAGGLDISIEGLVPNPLGPSGATVIQAKNYASAATEEIGITTVIGQLRVGVKGATGFAGTDSISMWVAGELRAR